MTADTTVADTLDVSWNATTNSSSAFRIAIQVAPATLGGNATWFIAEGGTPSTSSFDSNTRSWRLSVRGAAETTDVSWDVAAAGGATGITITQKELAAATAVRVESRQGNTGDFTAGTPVNVP